MLTNRRGRSFDSNNFENCLLGKIERQVFFSRLKQKARFSILPMLGAPVPPTTVFVGTTLPKKAATEWKIIMYSTAN